MKKDIHPKYNSNVKAKCSCGTEFVVGSTLDNIEIEICSQCHPFYTGTEKIVDKGGRVEKFKRRREAAAKTQKTQKQKNTKTQEVKSEEKKKEVAAKD